MQLSLNLNKMHFSRSLATNIGWQSTKEFVVQWRVGAIEFAINCKQLRSCGTFTVNYIHHHHFPYKSTSLLLLHTIKLNSKPVFNVLSRLALRRWCWERNKELKNSGISFGRTLRILENDFIAFLSKWVRISRRL